MIFDREGRRANAEGSAIVIVATDVPMLASQLARVSKRAALGLGRAGSYAASNERRVHPRAQHGHPEPADSQGPFDSSI